MFPFFPANKQESTPAHSCSSLASCCAVVAWHPSIAFDLIPTVCRDASRAYRRLRLYTNNSSICLRMSCAKEIDVAPTSRCETSPSFLPWPEEDWDFNCLFMQNNFLHLPSRYNLCTFAQRFACCLQQIVAQHQCCLRGASEPTMFLSIFFFKLWNHFLFVVNCDYF